MPAKTPNKPGQKSPSKANTAAERKAQKQAARTPPPGWKDPLAQQQPLVSGRWLASAILGVVAFAALCAYLTLCLLFYQGQWQVVFHPSRTDHHHPRHRRPEVRRHQLRLHRHRSRPANRLVDSRRPRAPVRPQTPPAPCSSSTTAKARSPTSPSSSKPSTRSASTSSPSTIAASAKA